MRYLKLFLFFTLFVLFSCEKEYTITFTENHLASKASENITINIPKAEGKASIVDPINTRIENHVIKSLQIGSSNSIQAKSIGASIDAFNNEFEAFKNDFPKTQQIWEAQIDGEVLYQSDQIISTSITAYTNTGGAHGILKISFLNFNSQNGSIISNSELFNDKEGVEKIAKPYYQNAIEDKNILSNPDEFTWPENIAYTEDGLVFLYNTYEIADYSEGVIEFKIPFDEVQPYLVFNNF
ncbi:DUF3298 and DUF4163 domain-containing protein [Tamlana haliotis]|uniref:DUF3298 and DUF4163 domain-containing protein n=1 Tax=Pseudotamlana haliotis TaxID=2614804 RepID=A0A6N6MDG3_9FLAO|nr:DUF3298 and DUF4163 domain-containing protein [Tamlana haliotis]KAB1067351.1 DUF3298 and DUF4163 domain-containing protein [Tamlana haliotis]